MFSGEVATRVKKQDAKSQQAKGDDECGDTEAALPLAATATEHEDDESVSRKRKDALERLDQEISKKIGLK